MAKIKGPLFSIEGIGKIGKSVIYSKTKGIKTAKEYKVPDNPNTDDQKEKRTALKDSVLAWQTDGLSKLDVIAWNVYASIQKRSLSGYNMFLKDHLNCYKINNTWNKLTNCIVSDVLETSFKVEVSVESDQEGKLYIGTSKYAMVKEFIGVFNIDKYTFEITELLGSTGYYFYIKNTKSGEQARTGIYGQKTPAETPPVPIDIGSTAIDRLYYENYNNTLISKNNPANASGKITKIEVYFNLTVYNWKIAIFQEVSANRFTTRSYAVMPSGPHDPGWHTFDVDLNVQEGDYIGFYLTNGQIDSDYSGLGIWAVWGADKIPCVDQEFSFYDTYKDSLYGTGSS